MPIRTAVLLFVILVINSGCASITGTTNQSVSVQTREVSGKELAGAACELTNNKGKWFVNSPGSVTITRSNDDLQVLCNKEGFEPGRAAVVSATKGQMFGNIIFGGGIGAIVDHNTGAAYEYPSFFQVVMGLFTKVAAPDPSKTEATESGAATLQPVSSQPPAQSQDDRLKELRRLHDAGLITTPVYLERQRLVLDGK